MSDLPEMVQVAFSGTKGYLNQTITAQVLEDGKINVNALKQAGRALPDADRYVLYADGVEIAVLVKSENEWTAHFVVDGEMTRTEIYPRSQTKRPQRKDSRKPPAIDGGPDLQSAVTRAVGELWPSLAKQKSTSTQKKLEQTKEQILRILEDVAEKKGKTVEEIAKEYGVKL